MACRRHQRIVVVLWCCSLVLEVVAQNSPRSLTQSEILVNDRDFATNSDQPVLSCRVFSNLVESGDAVGVDVVVQNVSDLRAFQTRLVIARLSGTGTLDIECPGGVEVNEAREDFVFSSGGELFSVVDCDDFDAASSLVSGTVDVAADAAYLSSYVFTVSDDATPGTEFEIQVVPAPGSALVDGAGQAIPFTLGSSCRILVAAGSGVVFVDEQAVGPEEDGLSWCTAFVTLDRALSVALSGTDIHIAGGMYTPSTDDLTQPQDASFRLTNGVSITGGFAGCLGVDPDSRDFSLYETVLSGDLAEDDEPGFVNVADNAFHVVSGLNVGSFIVLDGLSIEGGNADATSGGGILLIDSSPLLRDCNIRRNRALLGGGVYSDGGAPSLVRTICSGNQAADGAGIFITGDSDLTALFTRALFYGNQASGSGGAIHHDGSGAMEMTTCVFSGNIADVGGAVFASQGHGSVSMINSTVSDNSATSQGGGIWADDGWTIVNTVLWGNTDSLGQIEASQIAFLGTPPTVRSSTIQGLNVLIGSGNIGTDPMLIDPDGLDDLPGTLDDNPRLRPDSPCIDAGDNSVVLVVEDVDGHSRMVDDPGTADTGIGTAPIVDMGADEFDCSTTAAPTAEPGGFSKSRFISFQANNAGLQTALRVTVTSAPLVFSQNVGRTYWVGPLRVMTESSSSTDEQPEPVFSTANFQCVEHCEDFGSAGVLHIVDEAVIPNAIYEVQVVLCACDRELEDNYSPPLEVLTGAWGDVVGVLAADPPNGVVDFLDIQEMVRKFKNLNGAPIKARTDLSPQHPDGIVDFNDISHVVKAFQGASYPFDLPPACP